MLWAMIALTPIVCKNVDFPDIFDPMTTQLRPRRSSEFSTALPRSG
jgi:hypothetical protein